VFTTKCTIAAFLRAGPLTAPAWVVGRDGKPVHHNEHVQRAAMSVEASPPGLEGPRTALEFEQLWRKCGQDNGARLVLLRSMPPGTLQRLFRVELKSPLLAAMLDTLATKWTCSETDSDSKGQLDADSQASAGLQLSGACPCAKLQQSDSASASHTSNPVGQEHLDSDALNMLMQLTKCGRFQMACKLLPKATLANLQRALCNLRRALAKDSSNLDFSLANSTEEVAYAYGVDIADTTQLEC
jgi:hypothetical protein